MRKLLILQPPGDDGCTWYRLRQFQLESRKHGLDTHFLDFSMPENTMADVIGLADAYLLRLSDMVALEVFEQFEWDKINKPIFLDIDDNYEDIDPLSDLYRAYGTQEVTLGDGSYLWQDKVNFDIEKNKKRLEKYQNIMKGSTAIFVTTFELKKYAEKYNKNVVVVPNAINFSIFPKVKDTNKTSNEMRLLWSGGSTHYPDLLEVRDQLTRLMHSNLNLHFYILGVPFKGIVKNMPQERVHAMGWVKPDGHGYRLACIDADIAICPLKNMEFNKYKSSIKFYETSALRIPTVAKRMPPYSDDIADGANGLLYTTPDEFEEKVQELIDNPIKRIELGNKAYSYTKQFRNIESVAKEWSEFILGVINAYSTR